MISKKKKSRRAVPAPPLRKLEPIEYLVIGRAIGRSGFCGRCMGCLCYRDFCDYADALRDHDRETNEKLARGLELAAANLRAARERT